MSEPTHVGCYKRFEPRFGGAGKFHRPAAPGETKGAGVQGVMRQNEPGALLIGQAIFDQRQIQILVAAVEFIADDGMAEVGEVDADLVLATGAGNEAKEGKREWSHLTSAFAKLRRDKPALSPASGGEGELFANVTRKFVIPHFFIIREVAFRKSPFDPIFGLGGRAIGADAVLDGDAAALVLAERRVNEAVAAGHVAVNDGKVFLLDGTGFKDFSQYAGGFGIFGDEDDAAGFAVEAVDQTRPKAKG